MEIEAKLHELGLVLPRPTKNPPGLVLPFSWVRVRGNRAYVSGHVPLDSDGSVVGPFGKVDAEISEEEGYEAAPDRPGDPRQPPARARRPRQGKCLAAGLRHGQLRARLRQTAQRHKRLLGPDPTALRPRSGRPRPLSSGHGRIAPGGTCRNRGRSPHTRLLQRIALILTHTNHACTSG